MDCQPGDILGVVGKSLLEVVKNGGVLLNCYPGQSKQASKKGHALAAFVNEKRIRLYDMNAGEFEMNGFDQWQMWSGGADSFYHPDVFNFVDAFTLRYKGLQ